MHNTSSNHEVILKGVHLDLTESLKSIANEKVSRLFRHEERIVRIRVELEYDKTGSRDKEFLAKGHIEIQGPSLNATVASDDCLKSLDQLVDKLDRPSELGHHPGWQHIVVSDMGTEAELLRTGQVLSHQAQQLVCARVNVWDILSNRRRRRDHESQKQRKSGPMNHTSPLR